MWQHWIIWNYQYLTFYEGKQKFHWNESNRYEQPRKVAHSKSRILEAQVITPQKETDRYQSGANPPNYADLKAIRILSNPEYLGELIKHHAGSQSPLVTLTSIILGLSPKPTSHKKLKGIQGTNHITGKCHRILPWHLWVLGKSLHECHITVYHLNFSHYSSYTSSLSETSSKRWFRHYTLSILSWVL